jgi:hypothetical protein
VEDIDWLGGMLAVLNRFTTFYDDFRHSCLLGKRFSDIVLSLRLQPTDLERHLHTTTEVHGATALDEVADSEREKRTGPALIHYSLDGASG